MSWLAKTFLSSVGRKFVMAITGLFLCSFLLVHLTINLQLLRHDNGVTFNAWGNFMGTNPLIRTIEIGLIAGLLLHIVQSLVLAAKNHKARGPQAYVINHSEQNSSWASRNMVLLGVLLGLYLALHLTNFWLRNRFGALGGVAEVRVPGLRGTVPDLYSVAAASFKLAWYSALYVAAQLVLAYHLWHGFRSGFQSLGLNHRKYSPAIRATGHAFAVVVPLLFALIPVVMYFDPRYQPRLGTVEQQTAFATGLLPTATRG